MLNAGTALLAFYSAFARGSRRPGRAALYRDDCCLPDQIDEPIERILAIARLGAVALRDDDKNAVVGQPRAGEALQALADVVRQRRRVPHIEAKLDCGGKLVDVLAAWPRGAHEGFLDFTLVDGDVGSDVNHGRMTVMPREGGSSGNPCPGLYLKFAGAGSSAHADDDNELSVCRRASRSKSLRLADHGDQKSAVEQALGDAFGIVESHRIDHRLPP
jgi:hypothetical protein